MPEIKAQHIISFSSEDKVHTAENLLKPETYRKWKCAIAGEKQASVVIQLEKASRIHSIEIGNEGSAFVEVLVGRSSDPTKEFQVLLSASSFMTPMESKQNTNINRVRAFGNEKLSQNIVKEKWDLVKFVCTQQFNKTVQYGLAFVRLHSPPEDPKETNSTTEAESGIKLGPFKLKSEEPENDITVGSWFSKRSSQEMTELLVPKNDSKTLASAITAQDEKRNDSKAVSPRLKDPGTQQPENKRVNINNGTSLHLSATHQSPNTSKASHQKHEHKESKQGGSSVKPSSRETPLQKIKENKDHREKERDKKKHLSGVLKGVVFVLSGFQNPLRSEIRDKALEMGAKYKNDWDKSCTHLICAFTNTPKYTQVQSLGGRIVKKEWIYDCYKWRKQFPWRQFKLGNYDDKSSTESVSDGEDDYEPPVKKKTPSPSEMKQTSNTASKKKSPKISNDDEDEDYNASTDVDEDSNDELEPEDTDDELDRIRRENKVSAKASSREEELPSHEEVSKLPLPDLPDLFKKKHFFMYGDFPEEERRTLVRYIVGFNGVLEDYMSDNVKYVITGSKWDDNFDSALSENEELIFVRPKWIYQCVEKKKMVPYQPYAVVPS